MFTGAGDKAFCTGGNTKEYAEYYAGHPQEYRQYMRLFNDMVTGILTCDKPVVCRVNGMRIGGGQEIGMACDFSIAQDLARFGQAGPKHGSAPIGGATDFLPPVIGADRAMVACVMCEPFSAHKAYHWGMLADITPALKVDGRLVANPLVETQRFADEHGRIVYGDFKTGDAAKEGKTLLAKGAVDLSALDASVESAVREAPPHVPRLHDQDDRGAAQAEARGVEPQQGEPPRLARAEHDDRGARRLPRLQRRHQGRPRDRLRRPPPGDRGGRGLVGRADRADPAAEEAVSEAPLKAWLDRGESLLRLRLARPKANIIDHAMIAALTHAINEHHQPGRLRAALIDAEGPHFSFGASVEEHLPDQCTRMLKSLHTLLVTMLEWPRPILVAVQGQCLGGGLELAAAGTRIFASQDAQFGQPEIKLGVFAPAASCLLPLRIGQPAAEDLLLLGTLDRRRGGAAPRAGAARFTERPRRGARVLRPAPRREERELARLRRARRAGGAAAGGEAPARSRRVALPRRPDDDARRERGARGLSRQAPARLGEHD